MARNAGDSGSRVMADAPMTAFQFVIVALCCVINVADGADIVAMAYAAPLLAKEWGIRPEVLGIVFGAAPVGMAIGAFFVAPLADRFGRRIIVLSAVGGGAVAMLLTGISTSVPMLAVTRLLTGVGLGALLASLTVTVVEYTNKRWGNFFIAVLHIGFAVGVSLMGLIAAGLAEPYGWRSFFLFGAAMNAVIFVVGLFLLPESVEFLMESQPRRALERINRIFARIGRAPLTALPRKTAKVKTSLGVLSLLDTEFRRPTLLLWAASIGYAVVGYYHLNWTPHVLAEAGVATNLAISSGFFTGTGAIAGNLSMGLLSSRREPMRLTAYYFAGSAVTLAAFGLSAPNVIGMFAFATLISFFTLGGFSGLMIVTSRQYPALVRSTGVGGVVGFGRLGAVIGPVIGGILLGAGIELWGSYLVFAAFAAVPFVTLLVLSTRRRAGGAAAAAAAD
ncbi:MFS transporter [Hephaestia sp. GCM10023244]|uniref:MFS transporter n=1 Tax=unclassified Hephaestia TaxID=2631281 RepID=UPI00207769F5|nr:MFS transporter [Hephaestia sp. MAHUQ-44]MCM8732036.1 MFS transporter [Hephaestia sp. MAHUQ-44]